MISIKLVDWKKISVLWLAALNFGKIRYKFMLDSG